MPSGFLLCIVLIKTTVLSCSQTKAILSRFISNIRAESGRIQDLVERMEHYRERVFDKFISMQRPDTGKKSTGLGLNFVREVATLHGGDIVLENLPVKGLRAVLSLPV